MKIIQLPNGGIQIVDETQKEDGFTEELFDIKTEKSLIPTSLIDECNKLAEENSETYFIFDNSTTLSIRKRLGGSKEEKRDISLDQILNESKPYFISDISEFSKLPSRMSYYDTETRLTSQYERSYLVMDFFKSLGYEPSENNFGP